MGLDEAERNCDYSNDEEVAAFLKDPAHWPATDFERYDSLAARLLGDGCCPLLLPPESIRNIGGLSDEMDSRLCAVVCNRTTGMSADLWKDLPRERRIPWMEQAVENLPAPAEAKIPDQPGPDNAKERKPVEDSLTDNEYAVLRALRDARPRRLFMTDLATDTRIARKSCGKICKSLAKRGLVAYSEEKREGATITSAGNHLLAIERPLTTR